MTDVTGKHLPLRLGKKAARIDAITFKLSNYIDAVKLPKPPAAFGHETLIGRNAWRMLGNDEYGDCVLAGAAHETMLWNKEAHHTVNFSAASVLSDYSAITGFDPNDPNTDQGTDMAAAASYRRKTGVKDSFGKRHTIAAYLAIKPGDLNEHYAAAYLFGALGIGIEFPSNAMDQFDRSQPWDVVTGASIEGGHYVPFVAHRGNIVCVTWARTQQMTLRFFSKYNDESIAYVSAEALANNKSPEGFNAAQLLADLKALKSAV